jgi:hypothetical protein
MESVRLMSFAALAFSLVFAVQAAAGSGLRHIWAVDDGEKVFREDLDNPLKSGENNSVWDGEKITLFAEVNVGISDFVSGDARIRGSHPLPPPNDYRGLGVELFTEHYLHVETPSYNDPRGGGFNWSAAANPKLTGWIPDALIPFSAKPGLGGAPLDIAANSNQGVWGDVYVPREGAPPGTYTATATVTVGDETAGELLLELEVLDFALPDSNHYHSMVFYSGENIAARHGLGRGPELWEMIRHYHRMAHRHRIELIGAGTWRELEALEGTLTGDAFSPAVGYEGPGEGVGNTLYSVNTYGVRFPDSEEGYRRESDRWVTWFEDNAPDVEYFLYLTDEPGKDRFGWVVERARWIHDNPGPGGRLPVFLSKWPMDELVGAVDIWCSPTAYLKQGPRQAALDRGERVWIYAAYRPRTAADVLDEYGIAFRLKPWIAYQHDIPRWFTWESTHWYPNSNEKPNDRPKNIFMNPVIFTSGTPFTTGNGDGTLFYPGEDKVFPEQDRGYPGPMSSIRMKMYRRGVQDREYIALAEAAGRSDEVRSLVKGLLPATMWEAGDSPSWPNRNAVYEQARRRLAELILAD